MNRKYDGSLKKTKKNNHKGYASKAAKQARKDILNDKDMMVRIEVNGSDVKMNVILDEPFLNVEEDL